MDLLSYAKIPPAVLQVEVHPYLTQQALLDFCKASNIHVTAFSPLGSGSYIELGMDFGLGVGVLKEPSVLEIATAVGKTAAQVALRWGVQRYLSYTIFIRLSFSILMDTLDAVVRGCSVIPKSSSIARIRENFDILSFQLTEEQVPAHSRKRIP